MAKKEAKTKPTGDGSGPIGDNHYAYADWEKISENEPTLPSVSILEPLSLSMLTSPGPALAAALEEDTDLTTNAGTGQGALGQRIIVAGRVLDEHGDPVPGVLIEVWQANASGRYAHDLDQQSAPLDPNFVGKGRCISDEQGEYRFLTIKPGCYPWKEETNQWRPAHIHFSILGPTLASRLVTQMYFPGDPLFGHDFIFQGIPEEDRERTVCRYDHSLTEPGWAMGYHFDIVLRGVHASLFETDHDHEGDPS